MDVPSYLLPASSLDHLKRENFGLSFGQRSRLHAQNAFFSVMVEPAYVNLSDLYQLAKATQRLYLNLPLFYEDYGAQLIAERQRMSRLINVVRPTGSQRLCIALPVFGKIVHPSGRRHPSASKTCKTH
jgi:hypothetical protein